MTTSIGLVMRVWHFADHANAVPNKQSNTFYLILLRILLCFITSSIFLFWEEDNLFFINNLWKISIEMPSATLPSASGGDVTQDSEMRFFRARRGGQSSTGPFGRLMPAVRRPAENIGYQIFSAPELLTQPRGKVPPRHRKARAGGPADPSSPVHKGSPFQLRCICTPSPSPPPPDHLLWFSFRRL